jgi:acylphosphatase
MVAVKARITGRVQGVAFRAWTRDEAERRGLSGWVRNEPDGSVRALFMGPADDIAAMLDALKDGPPAARVADIHTEKAEHDAGIAGFRVVC